MDVQLYKYLGTVDCVWATITRTTLELWTQSLVVKNYYLNTQVQIALDVQLYNFNQFMSRLTALTWLG